MRDDRPHAVELRRDLALVTRTTAAVLQQDTEGEGQRYVVGLAAFGMQILIAGPDGERTLG